MLRTAAPRRARALDELLDPALASRLQRLDLASRRVVAGRLRGERRSRRKGESVEFADHRPYAPGDDLRFVDWRAYGRLERLYLKLFLAEEDLSLHLVLDASASMDCGEPGKFLHAQRLCAALAYVGLARLHRVTLWRMGGEDGKRLATLADLRGRSRAQDMGRWLGGVEPGGRCDFNGCARRIALSRRGAGVVVALSDFFFPEGFDEGLRLLAARGDDVLFLQVLSPQELAPDIAGDLRLRDVEDGSTVETTITTPLLARYRATLNACLDELRRSCAARGAMHALTVSNEPVEDVVLRRLRRAGALR